MMENLKIEEGFLNLPGEKRDWYASLSANTSILAGYDYLYLKAILYGLSLNKIDKNSDRFRELVRLLTADDDLVAWKQIGTTRIYLMNGDDVVRRCREEIHIIREYLLEDPYFVFDRMNPYNFVKKLNIKFSKEKDKYLHKILNGLAREKHLLL